MTVSFPMETLQTKTPTVLRLMETFKKGMVVEKILFTKKIFFKKILVVSYELKSIYSLLSKNAMRYFDMGYWRNKVSMYGKGPREYYDSS